VTLLAMVLVATVATAASAAARAPARQTLFLDALFAHSASGGPPANTVGHRDSASGIRHEARGRALRPPALLEPVHAA